MERAIAVLWHQKNSPASSMVVLAGLDHFLPGEGGGRSGLNTQWGSDARSRIGSPANLFPRLTGLDGPLTR